MRSAIQTLMFSLELRRLLEGDSMCKHIISLDECDRRIAYWTREAQKRIFLFAADPEGW
jgi:hypothetical protein